MISVTQVSMGTGSVDSGNSWFPWRLHLRSTGMTSVMSLCLFHNESHVSLPRQSFCVLGTRARLDDSLPKIHFVVSIATANSVLVLPCFPPRMAARAWSWSCSSSNFSQNKGQRQTISEMQRPQGASESKPLHLGREHSQSHQRMFHRLLTAIRNHLSWVATFTL